MAKRRKKLVKVIGPKLRITSKGLRVQAPRARIGGKAGFNVSKSGVSASVRTPIGTFNSKRGFTPRNPRRRKARKGCGASALLFAFLIGAFFLLVVT